MAYWCVFRVKCRFPSVDGVSVFVTRMNIFYHPLNIVSAKFVTESSLPRSIIGHLLYFTDWRVISLNTGNLLNVKKYPASILLMKQGQAKQEFEDAMTDGESRKSWNCPFLSWSPFYYTLLSGNQAWAINKLRLLCGNSSVVIVRR